MNDQATLDRWLKRPELWAGILAFLVRLWFLDRLSDSAFFEPIPGGNDRNLYDSLSQRVAHGSFFPQGVFEYMPLYPWFLGLIYAVAGPNLYGAGLIGALFDAATTALIVRLAVRCGASAAPAALAGLLYAFYPTAIIYSVITMPNTLNAFLLILFATILENTKTPLQWFGLGLLAGVTTLGFAGMLLIFLACLVYWAVTQIRTRQFCLPALDEARLRRLPSRPGRGSPSAAAFPPWTRLAFGGCLLGFVLPILPVTLHNWRVEHRFVLVTAHGGFNFYMGNHEGATGYPVQIEGFRGDAGSLLADARAEAERIEGRKLSAGEFSAHWSGRAWNFILTHPREELKLVRLKFLKFWNQVEYDDMRLLPMLRLDHVAFSSSGWPGFVWIGWLGLAGLILSRGCPALRVITFSGILGVLSFFVTARYRLTFAPLLAALGAIGISGIWRTIGEARNSKFIAAKAGQGIQNSSAFAKAMADKKFKVFLQAAVVCATGVTVWHPIPQSDFRALDRYNTAAYFMARGMATEALEQAEAGLLIDRAYPDLHFVAGNANLALGKIREAATAYEMTIRLKSSHASAHNNLALVYLKLKDPVSAAREAGLALKYDPQNSHARELLEEARDACRQ